MIVALLHLYGDKEFAWISKKIVYDGALVIEFESKGKWTKCSHQQHFNSIESDTPIA